MDSEIGPCDPGSLLGIRVHGRKPREIIKENNERKRVRESRLGCMSLQQTSDTNKECSPKKLMQ